MGGGTETNFEPVNIISIDKCAFDQQNQSKQNVHFTRLYVTEEFYLWNLVAVFCNILLTQISFRSSHFRNRYYYANILNESISTFFRNRTFPKIKVNMER